MSPNTENGRRRHCGPSGSPNGRGPVQSLVVRLCGTSVREKEASRVKNTRMLAALNWSPLTLRPSKAKRHQALTECYI